MYIFYVYILYLYTTQLQVSQTHSLTFEQHEVEVIEGRGRRRPGSHVPGSGGVTAT